VLVTVAPPSIDPRLEQRAAECWSWPDRWGRFEVQADLSFDANCCVGALHAGRFRLVRAPERRRART
jgi:hypothetical protein